MNWLLTALSASADPTRLRLLALAASGAFCVNDFCEILGQSQPRLSRHLKLLSEAGFLTRAREGTNVWFTLAQGSHGRLARDILGHLPEDEPLLEADLRGAARVLAERARQATAEFTANGADWDEMRALDLPADAVETRLLALIGQIAPAAGFGRMLDIGTGTGRLLEILAPRIGEGLGIDASRAMLALARVRLAKPEFSHITVQLADMYALPLTAQKYDLVVLHMVLHHATDPEAVLREARRVLAPGGRLVLVDLAAHNDEQLAARYLHRQRGFSTEKMRAFLDGLGLRTTQTATIAAHYPVSIWCAVADAAAMPVASILEGVAL